MFASCIHVVLPQPNAPPSCPAQKAKGLGIPLAHHHIVRVPFEGLEVKGALGATVPGWDSKGLKVLPILVPVPEPWG